MGALIMKLSISVLGAVAFALFGCADAAVHSAKLNKIPVEETLAAHRFKEYTSGLAAKYLTAFSTSEGITDQTQQQILQQVPFVDGKYDSDLSNYVNAQTLPRSNWVPQDKLSR